MEHTNNQSKYNNINYNLFCIHFQGVHVSGILKKNISKCTMRPNSTVLQRKMMIYPMQSAIINTVFVFFHISLILKYTKNNMDLQMVNIAFPSCTSSPMKESSLNAINRHNMVWGRSSSHVRNGDNCRGS